MKAASARGVAAGLTLVLFISLCSLDVPAAATPVQAPLPRAQIAPVALHTASTTVPNSSTSVPPKNAKRGLRLGHILLALPAVAVLAVAVATPLALRRYRERAARRRTDDG
jgi:hypothetical protein